MPCGQPLCHPLRVTCLVYMKDVSVFSSWYAIMSLLHDCCCVPPQCTVYIGLCSTLYSQFVSHLWPLHFQPFGWYWRVTRSPEVFDPKFLFQTITRTRSMWLFTGSMHAAASIVISHWARDVLCVSLYARAACNMQMLSPSTDAMLQLLRPQQQWIAGRRLCCRRDRVATSIRCRVYRWPMNRRFVPHES